MLNRYSKVLRGGFFYSLILLIIFVILEAVSLTLRDLATGIIFTPLLVGSATVFGALVIANRTYVPQRYKIHHLRNKLFQQVTGIDPENTVQECTVFSAGWWYQEAHREDLFPFMERFMDAKAARKSELALPTEGGPSFPIIVRCKLQEQLRYYVYPPSNSGWRQDPNQHVFNLHILDRDGRHINLMGSNENCLGLCEILAEHKDVMDYALYVRERDCKTEFSIRYRQARAKNRNLSEVACWQGCLDMIIDYAVNGVIFPEVTDLFWAQVFPQKVAQPGKHRTSREVADQGKASLIAKG